MKIGETCYVEGCGGVVRPRVVRRSYGQSWRMECDKCGLAGGNYLG